MSKPVPWQQRIGSQRDWFWRGWQTRYTYFRPPATALAGTTPVILLHGFGASIGHWRHNLEVLGQYHTVYALDMLGFGASCKAPANYKIQLWVEQVYDFWQTFIRQQVVLAGNSMGSMVCLAAAAAHPEMVKGIAMINLPDLSQREEVIPNWLQPMVFTVEGIFAPLLVKSLFHIIRRPPILRRILSGLVYANRQAVTTELVEILAEPAQDQGAAAVFSDLFKATNSPDYAPKVKAILPTLDMPMLLIWGLKDRMIPPSLARPRQYVELNPNLKLVELDDAGHCPHDECPEQVNQIVLDWLAAQFKQQPDQNISSVSATTSENLS
ncbi:MAG: alpha/beta fold hydrolase [Symploca sp. SIO3C6]|uniref:Alpha/beta fold hydrolase n=1 Tax=Symploca sp. SIO1C4 TaxID=2607765 RepID=A0A6B3NBI7_9CYAN|nr:alpha/beta fold hydrolase [Symploca sp. SIO3C6]NER30916.1 alpha/beta fold hydrolase [Symploca sp. SIO1C4]NET03537.1 alpha/beta fold hydrolase [Symploca sp. SIO2B6]NET50980.1 alpha/beta fold hydrolase [Merismopedia sp. SIO2A8]